MLKQAFPMEVNMNLTTFSVGSLGKLNGKIERYMPISDGRIYYRTAEYTMGNSPSIYIKQFLIGVEERMVFFGPITESFSSLFGDPGNVCKVHYSLVLPCSRGTLMNRRIEAGTRPTMLFPVGVVRRDLGSWMVSSIFDWFFADLFII